MCPASLRICLVTPAPAGSRKGNRVTALRWAHLLRSLGHRVALDVDYHGQRCDVLLALHAAKSHEAMVRYRQRHPDAPLVLALTGTALYGDIQTDPRAQRSLELATRLVVLQPLGADEVPASLRDRVRVIYQSVEPLRSPASPRNDLFEVCVMGHLRPVKDP